MPSSTSWLPAALIAVSLPLIGGCGDNEVAGPDPSSGPPFSDHIAFESDRDGGGIYIMRADGSDQVALTADGGSYDPAWSPNGRRIAFTHFPQGASHPEVFVMNADGTNPENLSNQPDSDSEPAWSPDGQQIAFGSYRDYSVAEGNAIFIMNADGTNPTKVVTGHCLMWPAWSPNGTTVAFNGECSGANGFEILAVEVDGSNPANLTGFPGDDFAPAWSPDGSRVAFNSDRDGDSEVYVMDADGGNVVQLTFDDANDLFATWSPDGKRIAFTTNRDGNFEIYLMDADGGNPANLTNHPAHDSKPSWSPGP